MTDRPASGAQLWRLNVAGLLGTALERSPGDVVDWRVAQELLTAWFAEHPEDRKAPTGPRWNKKRRHEVGGQDANFGQRRARVEDLDPVQAKVADMTADELLATARRLERRQRGRGSARGMEGSEG